MSKKSREVQQEEEMSKKDQNLQKVSLKKSVMAEKAKKSTESKNLKLNYVTSEKIIWKFSTKSSN